LNKDKLLLPIHSHNDYLREIPLFDSLSKGIKSIEADVWLLDDVNNYNEFSELYIGHDNVFLTKKQTLTELYLKPLEKLLDEINCQDNELGETCKDMNGVFYNSPEESLYLFIDIKTDADHTYTLLMKKLKDLIFSDYVSYYDFKEDKIVLGPISIILTGNIPIDLLISEENKSFYQDGRRYVFIDAPLELLPKSKSEDSPYDYSKFSLTASASLYSITGTEEALDVFNGLSSDQLDSINCKIEAAHSLDLKTRIWGTPEFPKQIRKRVWQQLIERKIDLLNVDDLESAYQF
ncbi:Aim6p ASCRUDRAFT_17353, partial [Ascoidea rubescens DSM 1968]